MLADKLLHSGMLGHGFLMMLFALSGSAFNYLYQLMMGRFLSPAEYGTLSSLLSLLIIGTVVGQTIEISVTKFISKENLTRNMGRIKNVWQFAFNRSFVLALIVLVIFIQLVRQMTGRNQSITA